MYRGTVRAMYRWPVKSLAGEPVRSARLDGRGMAGDRAYALIDTREHRGGKAYTVRQNPDMLAWASRYPDTAPGHGGLPVLRSPDGTEWSWNDPGVDDALSRSFGPVRRHAAAGQQDRGPTVLVTVEASRAALGAELGGDVDIRRFRPNLHLDLDAPPFAEEAWTDGTTIRVGGVTLAVTGPDAGPCIRCTVPSWDPSGRERWPELQKWLVGRHENKFGVIMRVTSSGDVSTGDVATARPAVTS